MTPPFHDIIINSNKMNEIISQKNNVFVHG